MNRTPDEIPHELRAAMKCTPIDPDWPIQGPLHALELLYRWEDHEGIPRSGIGTHVIRMTHSHAHELEDLRRLGPERCYQESIYTKYVSISWHLAGRYEYDVGFIDYMEKHGFKNKTLIDFGAAPWIQSIFYANKGMHVTAINSHLESDTNRFGRFLAEQNGYTYDKEQNVWYKAGAGTLRDAASFGTDWRGRRYDVIYAIDVLEHIPPLEDGSPGWIPLADALYDCMMPNGIWYVNAPLDKDDTCHPVSYHPQHFTSPVSHEEWAVNQKGLVQVGFSCGYRRG